MKNILSIARREYLIQARKKSFLLMTFLSPLLVLGFGALVATLFVANESDYKIYVSDSQPGIASILQQKDPATYQTVPAATIPSLQAALKETEKFDGILVLSDPALPTQKTVLFSNKAISTLQQEKLSNFLSDTYRDLRIKQLRLSPAQIESLDNPVHLEFKNLKSTTEDSDMAKAIKTSLAFLLMYVTFMFIVIYGVRVMRSVLEEKSNRVIEIIISSVRPFDLMLGKILGVTGVALTQFACWILLSVAGASLLTGGMVLQNPADTSTPPTQLDKMQQTLAWIKTISGQLLTMDYFQIIAVFLLFFLCGYLLYSAIYSAVGAAVDSETETQQFTLFAILPLTLGMYGSFSIINNPDGPMAIWLSMFPLTSPIAMVARIPFGVPLWQILVSLLLLIGTMLAMVWVAGRIYRVGILSYGSKVSLRDMFKWIKG